MKPGALQRRNAGADMDLGCDGGIHSQPPDEILGGIGIAGRERRVPQRVAIHHGDLRAKEAPGSLCTRAQVKGAGEKRPADVAAFQKEPVWIPFLNFQAEGNAEKTKPDFPIPPRSRLAQGKLGPGQPHRHALDRVRIQLDRGPKERPLGFDEEMPAANEKPFGIERLSPRRGELILRGLVHQHGVGLQKPSHRHAGLAHSHTPRRTGYRRQFRWRRRLLGQGGLHRPDQEESTQNSPNQRASSRKGMLIGLEARPSGAGVVDDLGVRRSACKSAAIAQRGAAIVGLAVAVPTGGARGARRACRAGYAGSRHCGGAELALVVATARIRRREEREVATLGRAGHRHGAQRNDSLLRNQRDWIQSGRNPGIGRVGENIDEELGVGIDRRGPLLRRQTTPWSSRTHAPRRRSAPREDSACRRPSRWNRGDSRWSAPRPGKPAPSDWPGWSRCRKSRCQGCRWSSQAVSSGHVGGHVVETLICWPMPLRRGHADQVAKAHLPPLVGGRMK